MTTKHNLAGRYGLLATAYADDARSALGWEARKPAGSGISKKAVTIPPVAWLSRPHPCPDIEDRIRHLRSTKEVSP